MKKKLLVLIVGETCAGKDTVARLLCEKFRTNLVVSYTTRPMRSSDIQGVNHHFVSKETFNEIAKKNDILAYTRLANGEYFALKSQIDNAMFYIIDPNGIDWFYDHKGDYDDLEVLTIHITLPLAERRKRAEHRNDNLDSFNSRVVSETKQFDKFALDKKYDYSIVNWYSKDTADVLEKIIKYHLEKLDN